MENFAELNGFIVEVSSKTKVPVKYQYNGERKTLQPTETFVGYFWQMTGKQEDGTFKKAHIQETRLLDTQQKMFAYGGKAVFDVCDISIVLRALRGPAQNNRHLPKKLQSYETWNEVSGSGD